jgi:MoaA/NifB/PqqE/SkfB family radical SAM enzyme
MCSRNASGIEGMHMRKEVFLKASTYFSNKTITMVGIGEPLLHPNIFEFIDICQKKNAKVCIVTNGTLLSKDKSKYLMGFHNMRLITFSIDGVGENYNRIRINSDFQSVVDNVKWIDALKKSRGSYYPFLGINFVGMKSNIRDLPELIRILGNHIGTIQVVHPLCYSQDTASNHLNSHVEYAKAIFEEITKVALDHNVKLTLPQLGHQPRGCINPWALPIIGVQGDIYPCHILVANDQRETMPEFYNGTCITPPEDTSLGNIMDTKFSEIWNCNKIKHLRKMLAKVSYSDLSKNYKEADYINIRKEWTQNTFYCKVCPNRWGCAC